MAIMISIQPQHCENILNLIKTLEIRKSCPKEWKDYLSGKTKVKPKAEKVYIYCTKGKKSLLYKTCKSILNNKEKYELYSRSMGIETYLNGKIVAEFTLNEVEKFDVPYPAYFYEVEEKLKPITQGSCLTLMQLHHYLKNKTGYAWHIDDLQIYDTPKELGEFYTICKEYNCCYCPYHYHENNASIGVEEFCMSDGLKPLTRPPQSWGYCEELEEL